MSRAPAPFGDATRRITTIDDRRRPMCPTFVRLRGVSLLSLLVMVLAGLRPDAALAQTVPDAPDRVFSAGPLQMQNGQSVAFGMLVPAVQRPRATALFKLTDSQGTTLFTTAPT